MIWLDLIGNEFYYPLSMGDSDFCYHNSIRDLLSIERIIILIRVDFISLDLL